MRNAVIESGFAVDVAAFNSHIRQSLQYCTALRRGDFSEGERSYDRTPYVAATILHAANAYTVADNTVWI